MIDSKISNQRISKDGFECRYEFAGTRNNAFGVGGSPYSLAKFLSRPDSGERPDSSTIPAGPQKQRDPARIPVVAELRKLLPYILPNLPLLLAALVFLVVSGALEALVIILLAPIFNQLSTVSGASTPAVPDKFAFLDSWLGLRPNDFSQIGIFMIVFSFFKAICLYLAEYLMSYSGQNVVAALRRRIHAHLVGQSLAFYAKSATGKIMARVISDTESLQEAASKSLTDFLRQGFLLIFFLGLIFYTNWKLSLLVLLIAPVVLGLTVGLGRKMRGVSRRTQENLSEISHVLQETITGQRIVKAFGMESYERDRFQHATEQHTRVSIRAARLSASVSPLIEFIGYASFVPFLLYANHEVNRDSLGVFVVFVAALFRLYEPVRKLSRMHLNFQQAFASSTRIFELLESPVAIQESSGASELPLLSREISFEGLSFSYRESGSPVLQEINLTIQKGEVVALVGSSGGGKSTLASLVPRFYDVSAGRIAIDGVDIRTVTLSSLRGQVAIVSQETFLFDDTVRRNIAYGREDCCHDQIVAAAKAAFIHDFILTLSDGYDTMIGERGERLSGGQRQRIAIARAVLKDAPILILDEATSALDTESERLLQEALYNLMRQRTAVVIAHRLSTVRLADRIVVMESGRIVETGNHKTLLERSGRYRTLYDLQFAEG